MRKRIAICRHFWLLLSKLLLNIIVTKSTLLEGPGSTRDEGRLLEDIFEKYNRLVRPVRRQNETLIVEVGVAMVLLINVDEKNQIMQTNVWQNLKWHDYQLAWHPSNYGNITVIRIPPSYVWLPDIVLFNNADGRYEVLFHSNVVLSYTGDMIWIPPCIYKSSCMIDVEYFPFDDQTCPMVFGSWTYGADKIILDWYNDKQHLELNDYAFSGIWDLIGAPASFIDDRSRVVFYVQIRRKTLFYTIILIIPTVLMAFLSVMVFYIPADASEKMTLAISILLALVVFLLLVSKMLPPSSSVIPLMAKYLLLTYSLNVVTIFVTAIIINISFRGLNTHQKMPWWTRRLFLRVLPTLLLMRKPSARVLARRGGRKYDIGCSFPNELETLLNNNIHKHEPEMSDFAACCDNSSDQKILPVRQRCATDKSVRNLDPEVMAAVRCVDVIVAHLKHREVFAHIRDEWRYVGTVIDRLLLCVFFGITLGGSTGILFAAPNVFAQIDQAAIIDKLNAN